MRKKKQKSIKDLVEYLQGNWQIISIVFVLIVGIGLASYLFLVNPNNLKSTSELKEEISHFSREGDFKRAVSGYEELIKREPDNYGNYYSLAKIYQREKDYHKAFENYERAFQLEESRIEILNLMANCQRDLENYDRAEEFYCQAIARSPGLSTPYVNLSGMLYGQNKLNEAKNILKEGLNENPNSTEIKRMLDRLE